MIVKTALVNLCIGGFLYRHQPSSTEQPVKTTILALLNHISHEHRLTALFCAAPTSNNTQQMAFNTASHPRNWEIQKQFWSNKWKLLNGMKMQMQLRSEVHVSDRDKHALGFIHNIHNQSIMSVIQRHNMFAFCNLCHFISFNKEQEQGQLMGSDGTEHSGGASDEII